jgi:hypothetical protein
MSKKKFTLVSENLFDEKAVATATRAGGLEDTLLRDTGDQQASIPASQPGERQRPKRGRPRKDAPAPETKKATYYMERTIVRALNIYAAETERSASDVVSEAVRNLLRRHGKDS